MRPATPSQQALALGALFLATFLGLSFYFLAQPVLPDGDSYYHLAIGREFSEHGIIDDLPWARFSIMRDGFGDNQFLFHLLLAPWTAAGEPQEMGRLAVAFFNAIVITVLAWLGMHAVGWWGWLVPAFIYLGSYPFADRVARLRPELLALTLMLLLIWFAAKRRRVPLFIVAALFALAYTAWHVVLALAVLFAIADRIVEKRIDWKTFAMVPGGIGIGLLVHPHFPHHLVVWWYQNALHYLNRARLDVSTENHPPAVIDTLLFHLPVVAASLLYWFCTRPSSEDRDTRPARFFLIAAGVFAILFLGMSRMVTWLIPLAVLAVIFRPREIVHRRPLAAGLALLLFAGVLQTIWIFRQGTGEPHTLEANAAALGRVIPKGAKVAADWPEGTELVFFAPQGRYLNVLDPTFMALSYPREYALSKQLFNGNAVDVAAAMRVLDSDYLLYQPTMIRQPLQSRLIGDPRFVPMFTKGTVLARLAPERVNEFVRDWRVAPAGAQVTVNQWTPHAWSRDPRVHEVEAYVDLSRSPKPCATAASPLVGPATIEIAPSGPTQIRIDGGVVAEMRQTKETLLGNGQLVDVPEGRHWLIVTTCAGEERRGFFALRR